MCGIKSHMWDVLLWFWITSFKKWRLWGIGSIWHKASFHAHGTYLIYTILLNRRCSATTSECCQSHKLMVAAGPSLEDSRARDTHPHVITHQERSVCPLHRSEEQGKETPPCFRGHIFCPAATWTMWLAVFKRNREWMLRWSTLTRSKPSRSLGNSSTSCSGAEWRGRGVATRSRSRPSLDMHSDGGSGSSRAESLNQRPLTKVVSVIPGTPTT